MSAVPVAPQALQDPAAESIEPPSVDRELARIIHERFRCNRRSAATTSLRPAGSPLGPSSYVGDRRPSSWRLSPSEERDRHRRRRRSQSPELRAQVSRRGSAISRRTVKNNAGTERANLTPGLRALSTWWEVPRYTRTSMACRPGTSLVCLVDLVFLFIWFIWFNQINKTNQINQITVFLHWRTFSASCYRMN